VGPAATSALSLCVAAAALLAAAPVRTAASNDQQEPAAPTAPAPGEPDAGTAPAPAPAPEPSPPPEPPETGKETWIDVGHAFIEQRLFAPVLRLDRFFSDERELEAERARSFVRFRNNLRVRDDGSPTYSLDVSANLRFPGLNRSLERLRVVIAAQSEEAVNAVLPDGPAAALRGSVGRADAGLRYGAWEGLYSSVDLGAGLILQLPPGVLGRVRYRASVPVRRIMLLRLASSVFWRTDTRFGTSLDLAAERPLGRASLVRLGASSQLTERSRGIEWSSELGFLRTLTRRSAIALSAGLQGAERAPVLVDRYRILTRYRRDLFRQWIYVELEPEVAWPWSIDRGRFRELALTFRLEVQFHGNEPPLAPPEPLGEPVDPTQTSARPQ
jgi:hypothetical protein